MIGREKFINVALTGQIWTSEVETSTVPEELRGSTFGDHGALATIDFAREVISCALGKESERNVDWRSESAAQHDHVMTILPDSCSLWRASGNTPEVFLFDLRDDKADPAKKRVKELLRFPFRMNDLKRGTFGQFVLLRKVGTVQHWRSSLLPMLHDTGMKPRRPANILDPSTTAIFVI